MSVETASVHDSRPDEKTNCLRISWDIAGQNVRGNSKLFNIEIGIAICVLTRQYRSSITRLQMKACLLALMKSEVNESRGD